MNKSYGGEEIQGTSSAKKSRKRRSHFEGDRLFEEQPKLKEVKHEVAETTFQSDHEENGDEAETPEVESAETGSAAGSSTTHIPPSQMARIVQNLKEHLKNPGRNPRKFLAFSGYDALDLPQGIDAETVKSEIRRYAREAMALSSMTVSFAADVLDAFLQQGTTVTLDPGFPKRPRTAYQIFAAEQSKKAGESVFKHLHKSADMYADAKFASEKTKAEKAALEEQKNYLNELRLYKERQAEQLMPEYVTHINKLMQKASQMIAATEKALTNGSPAKGKQRKKKVVEPPKQQLTPFELFMKSNNSKYADLPLEKREKKLRKKFDKLSDGERQIFENLAAAL